MTSILGQIAWAAVLYGALSVVGGMLAGPTRVAIAIRRWMAPVLNHRPAIAGGIAGFAFLLLVWWGGTHALRQWWGILLLGALLALGVVALRRQTLREFPDGVPAPAPAAAANGDGARPARSTSEELAQLAALRASGAIDQEEFEQAKKIILA
jgi:hypothetical protein